MKRFLTALVLLLGAASSADPANFCCASVQTAGSVFAPAWQPFKLGAGGFVSDLQAYPDGTMLAQTDVNGFFSWDGTKWNQLFTATSVPAAYASTSSATTMVSDLAGSGLIGGYGIGACAYSNNSKPTLSGSTSILYGVWFAEIFKSINKGVTWTDTGQAISGANGNDGTQKLNSPYVACDPASSGQVAYVSVPSGVVLKSTNGGASWANVAGVAAAAGSNGSLISFDPAASVVGGVTQRVCISSYGTGVYCATDGVTFTLTSGTPTTHTQMTFDQFGALWLLDLGGTNLLKRSAGSWSTVTSPSGGACSMSFDPASVAAISQHIVLLRCSGDPTISNDGGGTWSGYQFAQTYSSVDIPWINTAAQGGPPQSSIFSDVGKAMFDTSSNLIQGGGIGVWKSAAPVSGNGVWIDQSIGIEELVINRIKSPPCCAPFSAMWDKGVILQQNADIYPGPQFTQGYAIGGGWDVDYASQTPSFLIGLVTSNIGQGSSPASSTDGGYTWNSWPTQPAGITFGGMVAADTATDWITVPGQALGLFCTTNAGGSWGAVSLPGAPSQNWLGSYTYTRHILAADRVTSGVLYAYDSGVGLFSSSGGCAGVWTKVFTGNIDANGAFEGFNSDLQAVPGNAGHLFFTNGPQSGGTHPFTESFYRSTNGGAAWSPVANLQEIRAFGFGAPKPGGGGYPAIYVVGWVSGVYGVWQSVDNAVTWTQLGSTFANNDLDMVTAVSGDPNVYGRVYVGFRSSGDAYYDTIDACPSVNFSNIKPNATLTGTVTLTSNKSGLVPLTSVQYSVDSTPIGSPLTGAGPYSTSWNTGGVMAGAHTLKVAATGANCTGSFSIPITVPAVSTLPISETATRQDTAGGSPITYNAGGNPSIGATGANRLIVVAVMYRANACGISGVTVNGAAATQVPSAASGTTSMCTDIWRITDAAAGTAALTTAPVVVTYTGGASLRSEIAVYRILTATPAPSAANNALSATGCVSVSASVTSPAGGGSIGVTASRNTGTTNWTGMVADFDDQIAALHEASGTHSQIVGATTYNPTWASSVADCELSIAAWGP